jgi:PTH1 family peptidyl-tRNA hydrolase
MNLSGKAVRYHLDKFGVPKENLLVITDDIALDVGKIRLRAKGSDGGHNGLKSINELLGTQEYARLRVGVGSNFAKGKQADYVLGKFTAAETAELPFLLDRCEKAIYAFATVGVERAMNEVNTAK